MAKSELGNKRTCQNCGTKFFDFNRDPITCPKCGTAYQVAALSSGRASRAAAPREDEEVEVDPAAEVVTLEDADAVEDGKVAPAAVEDDADIEDAAATDDEDTFLQEEEEDDADVSDLIDGDIEDEEER